MQPWVKCRSCKFDPKDNEDDLVKSVYLSTNRFRDSEAQLEYEKDLTITSEKIREGDMPIFDDQEIKRLCAQLVSIREVSASSVWLGGAPYVSSSSCINCLSYRAVVLG